MQVFVRLRITSRIHSSSLGIYFIDNSWAVQHLLMAARAAGAASITIDIMSGELSPKEVRTQTVLQCTRELSKHFREMVVASGSSVDFVVRAELRVNFDFSAPLGKIAPSNWFSSSIIKPETVPYEGHTTIIDDRGREYSAAVGEWWRQ